MKTLLLLRHAKSSWDDATMSDHDRPLNARGRRAAPRMGRLLVEENLLPDHVFASTAVRARETVAGLFESSRFENEEQAGSSPPVEYRSELYLALPEAYLAVLAETPEECGLVLVVGHNPGLENLLFHLTGAHEHFPTAGLAQVELDLPAWGELGPGTRGRLVQLWRPKELDD